MPEQTDQAANTLYAKTLAEELFPGAWQSDEYGNLSAQTPDGQCAQFRIERKGLRIWLETHLPRQSAQIASYTARTVEEALREPAKHQEVKLRYAGRLDTAIATLRPYIELHSGRYRRARAIQQSQIEEYMARLAEFNALLSVLGARPHDQLERRHFERTFSGELRPIGIGNYTLELKGIDADTIRAINDLVATRAKPVQGNQ